MREIRKVLEELPLVGQVLGAADLEALRASDKVGDFLVETRAPWGFGPDEPEGGRCGAGTAAPRRCGCRS